MAKKLLKPQTIIPESLYVQRDADRQIRNVIGDMGRPGYILVARQMGKTNLLINAKRTCLDTTELFAYVDLSKPFSSASECFRYIIDTVVESLPANFDDLAMRLSASRTDNVPAYKEHERELRAILSAITGKLIISLDEIDSLNNAPFSDQIFAQIRGIYFSRINIPEFARLTYILSGVVDPNDIIKDKRISPFNIGQKIYLDDFSENEFYDFLNRANLAIDDDISKRIYHWTQGNPRITWDLCSAVEDLIQRSSPMTPNSIDKLVMDIYLTDYNRAPVDHIRELVADSAELRNAVRALHRRDNSAIADSTRSKLYLAGVVSSVARTSNTAIKNPIIASTLSLQWLDDVSILQKGVLRAADDRYQEGQFQDALRLYQRYVDTQDSITAIDSASIYYYMGHCAYQLGQYQDAIAYFEKTHFRKEDQSQRYFQKRASLGNCYFRLGNIDKSIEYFKEVLSSNFRDIVYVRSLMSLGLLYARQSFSNNRLDVLRSYQQVIDLCEGEHEFLSQADATSYLALAHYNLGNVYASEQSNDNALLHLRKACETTSGAAKSLALVSIYPLLSNEDAKRDCLLEAINIITSQRITPAPPDPERTMTMTRESFLFLLRESFFINKELFAKFAGYVLSSPEPIERSEQRLYYALATYCLLDKSISRAIELLESTIDFDDTDEELQYRSYQLLSALATGKREKFYYNKYFTIFRSSARPDPVSEIDFLVFEKALAVFAKAGDVNTMFKWISCIRQEIGNVDKLLLSNYALVFWWNMRAYMMLAQEKNARRVAQETLDFFANTVSDSNKGSALENKQIADVKEYAESLVKQNSTIIIPHQRQFGRNEWITVKYVSSNIVKKAKYKNLEADLDSGACVLMPQGL